MTFTDNARNDKALRKAVHKMVAQIKFEGLPRTKEGLQEMYALYNQVYGKSKKVTNCIYCRKTTFEYLEKAVTLLDMAPKQPAKDPAPKKPAPKKPTAKKAPGRPRKK